MNEHPCLPVCKNPAVPPPQEKGYTKPAGATGQFREILSPLTVGYHASRFGSPNGTEFSLGKKNRKYPQVTKDGVILRKNYCLIIDPDKHNRNLGCKFHDNAYGDRGGGGATERKAADRQLLRHMKRENDPLAWPVYYAVRIFGWIFFNYHQGWLWRGQLSKKLRCTNTPRN